MSDSNSTETCKPEELTQKHLHELLLYDLETGVFVWNRARRGVRTGVAGCAKSSDGYHRIRIQKKLYLSHRVAWLYVYGVWPSNQLDHIDGNKANNAILNLRETE
jgi:hypothetical protein